MSFSCCSIGSWSFEKYRCPGGVGGSAFSFVGSCVVVIVVGEEADVWWSVLLKTVGDDSIWKISIQSNSVLFSLQQEEGYLSEEQSLVVLLEVLTRNSR